MKKCCRNSPSQFSQITHTETGCPYQNCAEQIEASSGKMEAPADQRGSLALTRDGTFLSNWCLHSLSTGKKPCTLISPRRSLQGLSFVVPCCARQVLWSGRAGSGGLGKYLLEQVGRGTPSHSLYHSQVWQWSCFNTDVLSYQGAKVMESIYHFQSDLPVVTIS